MAAAVGCLFMIPKVEVVNELTEYLPEDTQTRQGVDLMEEQFQTFGTAKVMIENISYQQACRAADMLREIKGVSEVSFYEEDEGEEEITDGESLKDSYHDLSALFSITFETEEDEEEAQYAIAEVREALSGYDTFFYTTVDKDDSADLEKEMQVILVIAVAIITLVLWFTSGTYMEIAIFMMVFAMAALLNMGTNFIFGKISFITNAVGTVLQLALAIDYAIIMFHRFMEERGSVDTREALVRALEKGIPEIASSSLTTVAGMVALMFMQFGIGMDMGRVLTKAIILSMLSVFCFMPGLIMMFEKSIARTMHRSFVPKIYLWGKMVISVRRVTIPIFAVLVFFAVIWSGRCNYIYDVNSVESARMNEYLTSKKAISSKFELDNSMAIVVPRGDYESEAAILSEIEELDRVEAALGLANISVDEDEQYVLTDALNPQELSEVADMDIGTVRMLYKFYAWKEEKYGAFLNSIDEFEVPLLSMIDFLYGEEENDTFDLPEDLSEDIETLHKSVSEARAQLEGEEYARLLFTMSGPVEGEDTFRVVDQVREIAQKYYNEVYVVGDSTSDYDLSSSFGTDNMKISIMTAVFVGIILFFTFQSYSIPVILVATIQSSIWINFSVPYLTGSSLFFLSYLVVSSIQMGATIDYAIVITSRYTEIRKTMEDKKKAVIMTLDQSFATIITSGSIMTLAGFVIGQVTSNSVIASLGTTLGIGTLTSIVLVMLILPQLLYIFDDLIQKTWRRKKIMHCREEKK
ncbi:MAG: MMPL family transporter [Clostridiales bacterium]|nr:MMPL family transporter [Clostridiales bacterium]